MSFVLCLFVSISAVAAEPLPGVQLYEQAVRGCAWVLAGDQGRGTGWVADGKRRWLLTNYHVVGNAKSVDVVFPTWHDGKLLVNRREALARNDKAKVVGQVSRRDPSRDLALIELESLPEPIRALPLAEGMAKCGDGIAIIGNRRDLEHLWGFTRGRVRQSFVSEDGYAWRTERLAKGRRLLALEAPINEGDSGGPVLNDRGEVVGIVSAILWQAERAAAAIDLSELRAFLESGPYTGESAPRSLFDRTVRSVVWVQSPSATGRASGIVIDRERHLILTTAQLVQPHERVELIFPKFEHEKVVAELSAYTNATTIRAHRIAQDSRCNLALFEAESLPDTASAIAFAANSSKPGAELHAISNPNGIDALWLYAAVSVRQSAKVVVSSVKEDKAASVLVLQAPGSANDGGGPIYDSDGKLAAVAGGKDGPEQQVSYAIDVAEVKSFLSETHSLWEPRTAEEFFHRAERRMRVRQFVPALGDFQESLRLDPNFVPTLQALPELLRLRGEPVKARTAIASALKLLPSQQQPILLMRRAQLLLDEKRPVDAVKDCDAALKIDGKCALAFVVRAEAWRAQKEFAKALADVDEAIWLDANLGLAYLTRGRIHLDERNWDRAIDDLTRAIELEPFESTPLIERAKAHEEKGDTAKAKRDREAAARLK